MPTRRFLSIPGILDYLQVTQKLNEADEETPLIHQKMCETIKVLKGDLLLCFNLMFHEINWVVHELDLPG